MKRTRFSDCCFLSTDVDIQPCLLPPHQSVMTMSATYAVSRSTAESVPHLRDHSSSSSSSWYCGKRHLQASSSVLREHSNVFSSIPPQRHGIRALFHRQRVAFGTAHDLWTFPRRRCWANIGVETSNTRNSALATSSLKRVYTSHVAPETSRRRVKWRPPFADVSMRLSSDFAVLSGLQQQR